LVILDEATAQVDPHTERLLRTAIERIAAQRTTITIAHRLSTAAAADVVVTLADGSIIEIAEPTMLKTNTDSYSASLRATLTHGAP
jgi:ATP-binding cassette subfamily B protein